MLNAVSAAHRGVKREDAGTRRVRVYGMEAARMRILRGMKVASVCQQYPKQGAHL
jgi:hypothetical protein